jgi:hypothetical protein
LASLIGWPFFAPVAFRNPQPGGVEHDVYPLNSPMEYAKIY